MSVKSVDVSIVEIIPSQAGEKSLGVCNEQMLSPEGKVCSGLHGNMKRLAEMTNPAL